MSDTSSGQGNEADSPLDRAAAAGPLPGIEEQDAIEESGEDDSETVDPEEKSEVIGRGDLPGAIAMH